MGKCKRLLTMVLAAALCCAVLPVTAFAGGGPEDGSDKVLEYWSQSYTPQQDPQQQGQPSTVPTIQQTPQQGEPLSQGSEFSTRDLLYDKDTHKQFITVEGRDGNIFYIVIDYDAPVNGKEEQYQTYFLNKVDEADLAALVEQGEPAACSCADKCHAGAVNTSCPLCAVNMTECVGKEPEPPAPVESEQPDTDPEPEKKAGGDGLLLVILAVAPAGGGAVYFLKFKKKKPDTKGSADLDDYDYGDAPTMMGTSEVLHRLTAGTGDDAGPPASQPGTGQARPAPPRGHPCHGCKRYGEVCGLSCYRGVEVASPVPATGWPLIE